jgi:WD40-like Beta Propeller Repeat
MRPRAALLSALLCGLCLTSALAFAPSAGADVFGPISLVSEGLIQGGSVVEQADYAEAPAISADGRYIAFQGSIAGKTGVFRRDLQTGEIATVAEGDAVSPSISEEGRYISFTTTARLDRENDTNSAPDVYVRDMDDPSSAPCGEEWEQRHEACAFALASAVNGSSEGLHYEYGGSAFEETSYGSLAGGRSALSANGREVAFVTTAVSNLVAAATPTPKLQVAVRYLDTKQTVLVSARYVNGRMTEEPVRTIRSGQEEHGAVYPGVQAFPAGAHAGPSLSADGSTVAWMGQNISEQAPVLPIDVAGATHPTYTEPLWRRIGEGPQAPTRRITGGSDPLSPACIASGETEVAEPPTLSDPCQGPFDSVSGGGASGVGVWTGLPAYDYQPQLSANGMTVAFLATANWIASGQELKSTEGSDDLYIADMQDGLTRVQAARRLTELASGIASDAERAAPIVDLGISPDGSQIAFTTERTVFPLGAPAFVSPPAAAATAVELYEIDLGDETLTRVTQGFEGQPSEPSRKTTGLTDSPSFSANDELLAFASDSDNLVYGDGNDASDAFVVSKAIFSADPTPQAISAPPANPALEPSWTLGATAISRADGSVLLYVQTPGAGTLRAGAQSSVRVGSAGSASKAAKKGGHAGGVHAKASRASTQRRGAGATVATRTVAAQHGSSVAGGLVELPLKLAKPYGPLAEQQGGLYATVTLIFSAPGHETLRQSIPVTFLRTLHPNRSTSRRGKPVKHRQGKRR